MPVGPVRTEALEAQSHDETIGLEEGAAEATPTAGPLIVFLGGQGKVRALIDWRSRSRGSSLDPDDPIGIKA
jgi:hypothetical protein